jgi:DNA-binding SARP family transcriptional activator
VEFRILGPLEVADGDAVLMLAGAKQRALLAILLLNANQVVSSDRLIDELWGEEPPDSGATALQMQVSRLRKTLGGSGDTVVTKPPGYAIRLDRDQFDLHRFERLVEEAEASEPAVAAEKLREALALWRGSPLADLAYESFAQAAIGRLEELRVTALERRIDADLALGRHSALAAELVELVAEHPLRERLRGQLMLALYRSGRQAEALAAYQDARRTLGEELGIEPGQDLRELERAVLRQDPLLEPAGSANPPAGAGRAPLVGRERELADLLAGLEDAVAGRGRLFLLAGEPGIGKSRLADELIARAKARGVRVLAGRCWEAGGAPVYWPWLQSLRAYIREVGGDTLRSQLGSGAPDLAQLLPELCELYPDLSKPPALEPENARFRLFEAATSFLKNVAQHRPLLLVLDDLHEADEPSLLLLQFLARELDQSRLLVLGAYRDVDPTIREALSTSLAELVREPVTRTLSLGGLGENDVARLIELTTAHKPAAGVVRTVHAGTEGNPLFVGEMARVLDAEGRLDEPSPRLALPQSLKEVIARRLRRPSAECRRVLSLASVLGREFDLEVLARAGGMEHSALFDLLDEALAERLVSDVPGGRGRLRFAHALFRDSLYDELPAARRRQLHREVGEALEQLSAGDGDSHLAELAHHFCEAVPSGDPRRAVDYARRAGDHAASLPAPEEAVRLYGLALSLADTHTRPRLLLRTARSVWMARAQGAAERAIEARDALLADGDREGAAEAELLLANIHWSEGSRRDVSEHIQRALELVRGRPVSRTTAEVLAEVSRFRMLADEKEEAISLGLEGLAIAEKLGLESVRAHCLNNVGVARACSGDLTGLQDLQQAFEIAVAAGDGWATWRSRVNLSDCLVWLVGDADRAFAERHELRRLLRLGGSGFVVRFNQSYDAWESYWRGRWTEALRLSEDFIEQVEAGNPHWVACEMYTLRALIRASRNDGRALDDARSAVTLGRRVEDTRNLYPAIAFNAQVAAELGRSEEAVRLLDELLHAQGPEPFPSYVVPLSLTALACGRVDDVLAHLEKLGPSPWRNAAAAMLHGEYVEAAELFARIGVLTEEAKARLLAAEAFAAAAGRSKPVETQLERCVPFFESVGASAYVRRGEKLRSDLAVRAVP